MKFWFCIARMIILGFMFCYTSVYAQVLVDTFALPPGYTRSETQIRNTLKVDLQNNVWVGFRKIGAGKFDGSAWTIYDSTNSGLSTNNVTAISFNNSDKWFGTTSGISKYDGTSWIVYNRFNSGFNADTVNCLDWNNGILYVGTNQGLFSFDGITWNHYFSGNSPLRHDTINALAFNHGDTLWVGTNNGLYYYIGGSINYFGLESNFGWYGNVSRLITDAANTVWVSNERYGSFYPDLLIHFIRNHKLKTLNEIFNSYCTGYPTNPVLMGVSNDGGMWFYERSGYPEIVYNVHAEIPRFIKYRNEFGFGQPFNNFKILDRDRIDGFWSIYSNGNQPNDNLQRIRSEAHATLDSIVKPCYQLDINQVRTRLWPDGNSHWDLIGTAAYEVPKGSGKNALFCNGLWIGGKDPGNKLHLAAATYRQSGMDFWPGPLDTTNASADSISHLAYNKIWKVNRTTIATFVYEFLQGNVGNGTYTIPSEILDWPGNGGGNFSRKMAPYIDFNQDGVYNPFDGDRPDIKGDQFLWWVFNDNLRPHTETLGERLGIEIHASAYAWNCQGLTGIDTIINYTTFYEFDIINRSDTNYHDVHLGVYSDVDLGNYLDDFVGSSGENGYAFVYNGDSIDEGPFGYGANPPMLDYLVLKGPLAVTNDGIDNNYNGITDELGEHTALNSFMYYDSDFTAGFGLPNIAPHYYTYMKSEWRDSIHLTYGLSGRGGSFDVDFMFSGIPYDTGWTEVNMQNYPNDRRWIAGTGSFDLPSHENRSMNFAYVYSRYSAAPNGLSTSIAQNNIDVARIKSMWETQTFPCSNGVIGVEEFSVKYFVSIFPNPADNEITVTKNKPWDGKSIWKIIDLSGRIVQTGEFHSATDSNIKLEELITGVYFVDCRDKSGIYRGKFIVNK